MILCGSGQVQARSTAVLGHDSSTGHVSALPVHPFIIYESQQYALRCLTHIYLMLDSLGPNIVPCRRGTVQRGYAAVSSACCPVQAEAKPPDSPIEYRDV